MYCVGLISGTSLDGIDACVVEVKEDRTIKLHGYRTYPYPEGLKEDLLELSASGSTKDVCMYNVLLGKLFSNAARGIIKETNLSEESIGVIGSHGLVAATTDCPACCQLSLVCSEYAMLWCMCCIRDLCPRPHALMLPLYYIMCYLENFTPMLTSLMWPDRIPANGGIRSGHVRLCVHEVFQR